MSQITRYDTQDFNKALIGIDQIFDHFSRRFANQVTNNYPPFNVVRYGEDLYEVQIAVAGFTREEIDITVENSELIVCGNKADGQETGEYVHRGLAFRNFERVFRLTQYFEVKDAEIKDGLLSIRIERHIPEALKPRKVEIK